MARERLIVVRRQIKDQIWHEAISFEQYNWEQTHEIPKNTESSTPSADLSSKENPGYIREEIP